MKKVYEYSHLGGSEILQVRHPEIAREIDDVISLVRPAKTKISREKTMKGRRLVSPKAMNEQFRCELNRRGYHEMKDKYEIVLPDYPLTIKGAFKQIDFVKGKILVEVQFGKYPFMFYDLAKFQYFFNENKADVGIEIVPCHPLHKNMSTGVSYGEQLVFDIERLKRHFPAVPVTVILIDADDS